MTTPYEGTETETRQGVSAADAAKAAGVHLVFNSVGSANRKTGIPHFESKYAVEEHIARIGVRATILAPVYFMENLYFGREQLAKGIYAVPVPSTRKLAQVAVADIGAVALRVLENESRFVGRRFDLASDELTGDETVGILSEVTGRPFTYYQVPLDPSGSEWVTTAPGCTNGSTGSAIRLIARRSIASSRMSLSTASDPGRAHRIGRCCFKAHRN